MKSGQLSAFLRFIQVDKYSFHDQAQITLQIIRTFNEN